jgi:tetratricopeptide (TPR) repeat protein
MRIFLVCLVACGTGKDTPAPAPGSSAAKPAAAPVDARVADAAPAPTAKEIAANKAYRAAMARGRKATDAKDYDKAIAAFDEALTAKPGDARARAEQGFAYLLNGALTGASEAFEMAAQATKDPKLLSQIWFNRGLLDDKRDQPENAIVDYYIANRLSPSAAAKKKLAGKKVCPVHVEQNVALEHPDAKMIDGADWLALIKQMPFAHDKPTTNDAALQALTGATDAPRLPTVVVAGESGAGRMAYLVAKRGAQMRAIPVGVDGGGRCPGTVDFGVQTAAGDRIHVHGIELFEGGYTFMCRPPKTDDRVECSGQDGEEPAGTACFAGTPTEVDLVIDVASGNALVVASRPKLADTDEPLGKIGITLEANGLKIAGLDCDRVISL